MVRQPDERSEFDHVPYVPSQRAVVTEFERIGSVSKSFPETGGEAGFAFTVEELEELAGKWESLAHEYEQAKSRARAIGDVESPALDYASRDNAEAVRTFAEALQFELETRASFCREMERKFRDATGSYLAVDADAATTAHRRGGEFQ